MTVRLASFLVTRRGGLTLLLLSASQQLGAARGLAIFSAIATARTSALLATHTQQAAALTAGFRRALLACAVFVLAAASPPRHRRHAPPATRFPRRN